MLQIKAVLMRKDACSVIVAIIIASLLSLPLSLWAGDIVSRIWGSSGEVAYYTPPTDVNAVTLYVRTGAIVLVSLLLLEVGIRLVQLCASLFKKK